MSKQETPTCLRIDYIDNCIEQTLLWIEGESVHKNDECTFDFSCCYPNLQRPLSARVKLGIKHLRTLHVRRDAYYKGVNEGTKSCQI